MTIQVAEIIPSSTANGHGNRFCIWVQGCQKRCVGCCNPDYQSMQGGVAMSIDELVAQIASTPDLDGVTFSGGEPFLQAKELAVLAKRVQTMGLTVLVFTGYTYHELAMESAHNLGIGNLLYASDMLIAGPFDWTLPSDKPLLGSSNQRIVNLSGRIPDPAGDDIPRCEIIVGDDGVAKLTGFPTPADKAAFDRMCSQ